MLLIEGLELTDKLLHIVSIQLGILLDALLFLHRVDDLLKLGLRQLHHDVGEHLDETAVGVVSKARAVGDLRETFDNSVVQAQVKDGVHHAGHGRTRAGTHGDEQRVGRIGELLAADFLHLAQILIDLRLDFVIDLTLILIILRARFRGNGEALRDRHSEHGHFRKVRALAAEKLAHFAVALREKIDILVAHWYQPPVLQNRNGKNSPARDSRTFLLIPIC